MKYVSFICICLLFFMPAISQQRLIPATVKSAFLRMYPTVQNETWDNFTKDYNANFKIEGRAAQASFTAEGEWQKTRVTIDPGELPETVNTTWNASKYKDFNILHVYLVSSNEYMLQYVIEVEGNYKQRIQLQFTPDGKMI